MPGPFAGPIHNLEIRQPSSVEMEGVSMESIKASMRRASEFLQSLIFPSHKPLDEPLADDTFSAEAPATRSSLESLGLSPRVFNCLWRSDIHTIETVISMSDEDLMNIRGLGEKALTELKECLSTYKNLADEDDRHP